MWIVRLFDGESEDIAWGKTCLTLNDLCERDAGGIQQVLIVYCSKYLVE